MENKIYKLAVIGCGSRARGVISHLIDDDPNRKIEVVSIYDPDPAVMKNAADKWNCTTAKHCSSYQEAIDFPGVDWVMVFSPNAFHKEHVVAESLLICGNNSLAALTASARFVLTQ